MLERLRAITQFPMDFEQLRNCPAGCWLTNRFELDKNKKPALCERRM
jgi:hypothetical protein